MYARQIPLGPCIEIACDVAQFARDRVGTLHLRLARSAVPEDDVAVEVREILAQPLLARDHPAFFRRDDTLAQTIDRARRRAQAPGERPPVPRRQLCRAVVERLADRVDTLYRERHVAERTRELYREIEFRAPLRIAVRAPWIGHDDELGCVRRGVFRHPDRVRPRKHVWSKR